MSLSDQLLRERFCTELDTNFSVLAPAGVGKTHSIVQRVVAFAQAHQGKAQLVVVTYTRKAAREMEMRAQALWKERGHKGSMSGVYFGTIHSFCMDLIGRWGHWIGLADSLEPTADDWACWNLFLTDPQAWQEVLAPDFHSTLGRLVALEDILRLARTLPDEVFCEEPSGMPTLDFSAVLGFVPENKRLLAGVNKGQALVREWLERWHSGNEFARFPTTRAGGEDFIECFEQAWRPLKDWAGASALILAKKMAQRYRAYRLSRGQIMYDDMVHIVLELLDHPHVGQSLLSERYHIILDEAQDTDAAQFKCLLRLSGNAAEGRFSMVGDPQQAIYTSRACFTTYRSVHEDLIVSARAHELSLEVTFRCAQQVVIAVNECFPSVLDGDAQVNFSQLAFPDGAHEGQVCRIKLDPPAYFEENALTGELAGYEASAFAQWFGVQTLEQLRARDYKEVAILCPRSDWLTPIAQALERFDIKSELRLSQARRASPDYGKIAGLVSVLADPKNTFELVGALWGVCNIPQAALEAACKLGPLSFERAPDYPDCVKKALQTLQMLSDQTAHLPLSVGLKKALEAFGLLENPCAELTVLQAQSMEGLGLGWQQLDQWLARSDPTVQLESAPLSGHVQLITCHAAKGLEWDCVILPFFYRSIAFKNQAYPRVVHNQFLKQTQLTLDAAHRLAALEDAQAQLKEAELERLLYVSATRARHSLIFCDDSAFFKDKDGSFAQMLGLLAPGSNRQFWEGLSETLTCDSDFIHIQRQSEDPCIQAMDLPGQELPCALSSAPARLLPSSLERRFADDAHPGNEVHALEHGNAWHALMRELNFHADKAALQAHFDRHLPYFPDPQKARAQWASFVQSDLAAQLRRPDVRVLTEVPILVCLGDNKVVEGFIDALVSLPDGSWLILDWKTDALDSDDDRAGSILNERYGDQMALYAQSLLAVDPTLTLRCFFYSTALGKWVEQCSKTMRTACEFPPHSAPLTLQ